MVKKDVVGYQQQRDFMRQGYLKVPGIFKDEQTSRFRRRIHAEAAQNGATSPSNPNGKLYGLHRRMPDVVGEIISTPGLVDPLISLLGPNVVLVTNRHNHATAN